jgi:hypothetical protein
VAQKAFWQLIGHSTYHALSRRRPEKNFQLLFLSATNQGSRKNDKKNPGSFFLAFFGRGLDIEQYAVRVKNKKRRELQYEIEGPAKKNRRTPPPCIC